MWKKTLTALCLAVSLAACATQGQPASTYATPGAAKIAGCVPSRTTSCAAGYGATYSQQDLQHTGVPADTATALRRLDPSITVH
jgi:hypothetical protein